MIMISLVYNHLKQRILIFLSFKLLYLQREPVLVHGVGHVSTVAQNRQTKHWDLERPFHVLVWLAVTVGSGELRVLILNYFFCFVSHSSYIYLSSLFYKWASVWLLSCIRTCLLHRRGRCACWEWAFWFVQHYITCMFLSFQKGSFSVI